MGRTARELSQEEREAYRRALARLHEAREVVASQRAESPDASGSSPPRHVPEDGPRVR